MRRWLDVALAGALLAPLVVARAVSPEAVAHGPIVCWLRALTGVPCPTCGLTRSFVAFAHGGWLEAFRAHPAGPILFLGLALGAVAALRGGPPIHARPAFARVAPALATLTVVAGLVNHLLRGL
jgi:uncharacterized protein DUF2752